MAGPPHPTCPAATPTRYHKVPRVVPHPTMHPHLARRHSPSTVAHSLRTSSCESSPLSPTPLALPSSLPPLSGPPRRSRPPRLLSPPSPPPRPRRPPPLARWLRCRPGWRRSRRAPRRRPPSCARSWQPRWDDGVPWLRRSGFRSETGPDPAEQEVANDSGNVATGGSWLGGGVLPAVDVEGRPAVSVSRYNDELLVVRVVSS